MTTVTQRIPLPWGTDVETWAGQLVDAFPHDWIPRLIDAKDWRRWAGSFLGSPSFQQYHVPDPYSAKNWQDWASQLLLVTQLGS
jgi:hypothetical protein